MVKLRLLKIPEKKRQAILNQVEANLGNKLIEFVSDVKGALDESFNQLAEGEESGEDYRTPEGESRHESKWSSRVEGGNSRKKQSMLKDLNEQAQLLRKGQAIVPGVWHVNSESSGASDTVCYNLDIATDDDDETTGGELTDIVKRVNRSVRTIRGATSNYKNSKLSFTLAEMASVANKTSSIQRDVLLLVDRCHETDAKYRHQLAVNKNLQLRLQQIETRLDERDSLEAQMRRMWGVINEISQTSRAVPAMTHVVESEDGGSQTEGGRSSGSYATKVKAKPTNKAPQGPTERQDSIKPRKAVHKTWETPPADKSRFEITIESGAEIIRPKSERP